MIYKQDIKDFLGMNIELWNDNLASYSRRSEVPDLDFVKRAFYLTSEKNPLFDSDYSSPEKSILVRTAFAGFEGKPLCSRYVMMQTYYDEGRMSTIDIVALPIRFHRRIVQEYLDEILPSIISRQLEINDGRITRFFTTGGNMIHKSRNVEFGDESREFSTMLGGYNAHDVAAYFVSQADVFNSVRPNFDSGRQYAEKCFNLMQSNAPQDFYEALANMYIKEPLLSGAHVSPKNADAIIRMKAYDRAINEHKGARKLVLEENAKGIGAKINAMFPAKTQSKSSRRRNKSEE